MRTSSQMSFAHCALASNAPTRVDFPIPDGAMRAMAWSSMEICALARARLQWATALIYWILHVSVLLDRSTESCPNISVWCMGTASRAMSRER